MPTANLVAVADAVVAALNAATLSRVFTAQRAYVPVHDAEEIVNLEVSVVARSQEVARLSRGSDDFSYVVDIGIQQRIGTGAMDNLAINAAADPLAYFAQEVLDLFRGQHVIVGSDSLLCAAEATIAYVPEHMDQHRVFTSVVTLTFRQSRAR